MRTFRMGRAGSAVLGAAVTAALVLVGGSVAHADSFEATSDELQAGGTIALGEIACGVATTVDVDLTIARGGNAVGNTFLSSSSVLMSRFSSGNGVTATEPSTILIPVGWADLPQNSNAETNPVRSTVTVNSTVEGAGIGAVTYQAHGVAADLTSLSKQKTLLVTWTVLPCTSDTTAPVVDLACPTDAVILGSTAVATWTASDEEGGSGLATAASGELPLDTSSVGTHTATAVAGTAVDVAGNESAAVDCAYSVIYDFAGFFRPVDMGDVVNSVKAGSAVPIKFSLHGDQGLDILASTPKVTFTACAAGASIDPIEVTASTAGGSSLTYDPLADQYTQVWKTDKAWAGKCGTFSLMLDDGKSHTAKFQFLK